MKCKIDIQNLEPDHEKYVVARLDYGMLWYWGSWDNKGEAELAAKKLYNAIVLETE